MVFEEVGGNPLADAARVASAKWAGAPSAPDWGSSLKGLTKVRCDAAAATSDLDAAAELETTVAVDELVIFSRRKSYCLK